MLLCTYLLLAYSVIDTTTTTQPSNSIVPCTVNPSSVVCAAAVMDDESGNDILVYWCGGTMGGDRRQGELSLVSFHIQLLGKALASTALSIYLLCTYIDT